MGQREDTDTAAARLATLHAYFRQRPVESAEGHSYTAFRARTPHAASPIPYDTDIAEHITAAVGEVVQHTREVNPDAGPLPRHVADVYDWARQHTAHAPGIEQQRRDTLEYRHRLEHAIAAGDASVVRPHRCPACRTLGGLFWQAAARVVVCVNLHCAAKNGGVSRQWTLARLAYEHVAAEKMLRDCAT